LHQSVEKGLKAAALKVGTATGNNEEPRRIHDYWSVVDNDSALRGLRKKILKSIEPYNGDQIRELGGFAPTGSSQPNFEYPWEGKGRFEIPSDFFDNSSFGPELAKYEGISSAIIREVANQDHQLSILFKKIIPASGKIHEVDPVDDQENQAQ
jgi:hypothetical protein